MRVGIRHIFMLWLAGTLGACGSADQAAPGADTQVAFGAGSSEDPSQVAPDVTNTDVKNEVSDVVADKDEGASQSDPDVATVDQGDAGQDPLADQWVAPEGDTLGTLTDMYEPPWDEWSYPDEGTGLYDEWSYSDEGYNSGDWMYSDAGYYSYDEWSYPDVEMYYGDGEFSWDEWPAGDTGSWGSLDTWGPAPTDAMEYPYELEFPDVGWDADDENGDQACTNCQMACTTASESCHKSCAASCTNFCEETYKDCVDMCGGFSPCMASCSYAQGDCLIFCDAGVGKCDDECEQYAEKCFGDCPCN